MTTSLTVAQRYEKSMILLGKEPRKGQLQLIELGLGMSPGDTDLVRAPTATGKSLAALIIGGVRAERGERTIIGTYTKLLQDQYRSADFEQARKLFPEAVFEVLKGASNYLCRVAAKGRNGSAYAALAMGEGDPGEVIKGLEWARADWKMCRGHKPHECGYAAAKERAKAADVVVTNHALILINGENPNVLGPHNLLIVDEIHNLPRAAEDFGTVDIDLDSATALLAKTMGYDGNRIGETLIKLLVPGDDDRVPTRAEITASKSMVTKIDSKLIMASETLTGLVDWVKAGEQFYLSRDGMTYMPTVLKKFKDVKRLRLNTVDIAEITARALVTELTIEKRDEEPETFGRAVLMMSATVGTPARPTFVATRCGVPSVALTEVDSPLDYPGRMRVSLISRPQGQRFPETVYQLIKQTRGRTLVLCRAWSNASGQGVEQVYGYLAGLGLPVNIYHQVAGDQAMNAEVVRKFKIDTTSVLVGTASFFEGIDVPGDTLSQVIIVMLPKPMVFNNPVAQERQRRIGAGWRGDVEIPQTALVLEQMMGRLIRQVSDRGLVAIMDDEAKKGWGHVAVTQAAGALGVRVVDREVAIRWFKMGVDTVHQ